MSSNLYDDLLEQLAVDRQAHTREVGRKARVAAAILKPWIRADLVIAATLHDIGYAHRVTGCHALDGARYLARHGFSEVVCNLVIHHSASEIEAEVRKLDVTVFDEFATDLDLTAAHQVFAWADITTGPTGDPVKVEERLAEIQRRYRPEALVTTFIKRAKPRLLAAGQSHTGSMRV